MSSEKEQTFPNPRRAFFKKIAVAAAGTVAAGGILPNVLKAAEKQADKKIVVKPHPEAVKRTR